MNKMDIETKKKIDNFLYYNGKKIVVISVVVVMFIVLVILLSKKADLNFGIIYFSGY
jgi:hypothetical protein